MTLRHFSNPKTLASQGASSKIAQSDRKHDLRIGMAVFLAAAALVLLPAGSIAEDNKTGPPMDKDAFKAGCEGGHGSYIQNPDGSFQCNTSGGGTVWCAGVYGPCTYTQNRTMPPTSRPAPGDNKLSGKM
jgi:hypothetical protein